ncbi:MAG TPA: hypothetical protein EYP87_05580, partial [Flavobacteriaceae bacterium]|nr:hypothetical protein [Flavobacteriaceae bacterium]
MIKKIVGLAMLTGMLACNTTQTTTNTTSETTTKVENTVATVEQVPNDSSVRTGTFANGLKYYIKN